MENYEWAVIGSGVAGITSAEILTRQGHSVILIEKNKYLASETTRDFHEWMHTGSLYTLIPDNLMTLKFMLGAIDDLIEYYSSFTNMNLITTEKGLIIDNNTNGWFENNNIHFKFRIKDRKLTFPWLIGVARAIYLINKIKEHDWLRRRAGVTDPFKYGYGEIIAIFKTLLKHKGIFYDYTTSDFTTNSRNLLNDLLKQSVSNGLKIVTESEFISYEKKENKIHIKCRNLELKVDKLLLCIGGNISKFADSSVKNSYAPMAVVENVSEKTNSFVELDYFPNNCINIISKGNGIGLIGGISFSNFEKCKPYILDVFEKHKKYNPNLNILTTYNGIKSEITLKNQPRNYLYHIWQLKENVWGIIPGKFTLGFSIAPEFYRRVYRKNPRKHFKQMIENNNIDTFLSNTVWFDSYINSTKK